MSRLVFTKFTRPACRPLSISLSTQAADTKQMIMAMRKETQLPLKNCREALQETNWDFEAAKAHLKKEAKRLGLKKMASLGKSSRLKVVLLNDFSFTKCD